MSWEHQCPVMLPGARCPTVTFLLAHLAIICAGILDGGLDPTALRAPRRRLVERKHPNDKEKPVKYCQDGSEVCKKCIAPIFKLAKIVSDTGKSEYRCENQQPFSELYLRISVPGAEDLAPLEEHTRKALEVAFAKVPSYEGEEFQFFIVDSVLKDREESPMEEADLRVVFALQDPEQSISKFESIFYDDSNGMKTITAVIGSADDPEVVMIEETDVRILEGVDVQSDAMKVYDRGLVQRKWPPKTPLPILPTNPTTTATTTILNTPNTISKSGADEEKESTRGANEKKGSSKGANEEEDSTQGTNEKKDSRKSANKTENSSSDSGMPGPMKTTIIIVVVLCIGLVLFLYQQGKLCGGSGGTASSRESLRGGVEMATCGPDADQ